MFDIQIWHFNSLSRVQHTRCTFYSLKCVFYFHVVTVPIPTTSSPTSPLVTKATSPTNVNQKDDDDGGLTQSTAFVLGAIVAIVIVGAVAGGYLFYRLR